MARLMNAYWYSAGILFLALARAKSIMQGYSTPKPFGLEDLEGCIAYDLQVVDEWLKDLAAYSPNTSIQGANVLELGPGADLGIGLYLLSKGVNHYCACDVNDLASKVQGSFYQAFLERLKEHNGDVETTTLKGELDKALRGQPSSIKYVVREDFDLVAAFGSEVFDVVFSQAAFEHFDDVSETIEKLSTVSRPGAILVAEVDLQTHSRWIRDKDPNNIYRYGRTLYRWFSFRGIPNRVRPAQYHSLLSEYGWTDINIAHRNLVSDANRAYAGMNRRYISSENEMEALSILITARKAP